GNIDNVLNLFSIKSNHFKEYNGIPEQKQKIIDEFTAFSSSTKIEAAVISVYIEKNTASAKVKLTLKSGAEVKTIDTEMKFLLESKGWTILSEGF
ncbi:MAG: hypothetical protein ABIH42_05190, partial [Planctomycetota bacterium]